MHIYTYTCMYTCILYIYMSVAKHCWTARCTCVCAWVTLGEVILDKMKTDPSPVISYHKIEMQPEPGTFTVTSALSEMTQLQCITSTSNISKHEMANMFT